MLAYILKRITYMIPTLILISVISFFIIQLPPGDFLTSYISQLTMRGESMDMVELETLTHRYGLDQPVYVQYFKWIWGFIRGDLGRSFIWNMPVATLIGERLLLTITLSLSTLIFVYLVGIPIGIYSATHQYSTGDYTFSVIGFVGLATPNFLLALVLMVFFYNVFGMNVGGLFSREFAEASWSLAKIWDLLKHLVIPVFVLGTAGTCGLIRVMRGTLLDELNKQYVITARTKGVSERKILFKYPVRVAINPLVSGTAYWLSNIISGAAITSIVLSLPTNGPLLLSATMNQDMYLAGSLILISAILVVIGTLISDILLAWLDPRIRY